MWYRASSFRWEVLDRVSERAGDLPLGIDEEALYHQFTFDLERRDLHLFYTDALTEAADEGG